MVPQALAAAFPENISIVTQKEFADGEPIPGWEASDAQLPFRCFRVSSLYRTVRWRAGKLRGLLILLFNQLWVRPKAWRELRSLLSSYPFDVVCLNTISSVHWLPARLRELQPKLKVVVYAHGEEWVNLRSSDWGRRTFNSIQDADAFVPVSSFTRDRILAEGIPAERIHLVHNGVDLERFSPGPPRPELLDRYGIWNRPNILCIARLDERKGQDALIGAMPSILKRIPNAVLILVGSGSDEPRLKKLVHDLHLESSVIFTGSASEEDLLGWYRTADLYAMPNRTTDSGDTEGFGLVFLEAGACGLAVIGGRAGGVVDAIRDGETGYLVNGRSADDVANACIRLLLDKDLRLKMGRNGLTHAQQNSWPRQADKFLDICDALVFGGTGAAKDIEKTLQTLKE